MNKLELQKEISAFKQLFKAFELLLEYRRKLPMADDQMAIDLCEFYAIWSACRIRRCIGSTCDFETDPDDGESEKHLGSSEILPKYRIVEKAAQDLTVAVASVDKVAISGALKEMGVPALCPTPEQLFPRMEDAASRVRGPARQVFLVDLSFFAAEVGDYQRAGKYIEQARTFDPTSRELYNICVIEGLIALNNGRVDEAIQSMTSSVEACQADVDSSIQCSLLDPNLELAERLLEAGQRTAVIRYLLGCHNVWQLYRPQIDEWIHAIEVGEKPYFQSVEFSRDRDQLSYRLNVQWMRACSLEMHLIPPKPKMPTSPAQVLAERERRHVKYEPRFNAYVKKKLEYLEEGSENPFDQTDDPPKS